MASDDLDLAAQKTVETLREDCATADPATLRLLLTEARTHNSWQDRPVEDSTLREIYDLMKWGPTSQNQQPIRILFLRSAEEREKLRPALNEGNIPKVMSAPVTAIIAYDTAFYENLPEIFPPNPKAIELYNSNPPFAEKSAFRNGTLQAAYFMIAARSLGLDCGPMSGFKIPVVDEAFFKDTTWKTNFLCNIGYGDTSKIFKRLPRLDFDRVARIL